MALSTVAQCCIPPSVTKIGKMAFAGCNGLRKITVERAVPPTVESNAFDGVDKSIYIEVSFFDSVEDYKKAEGWKEFENIKPYVFGDLSEI